MSKTPQPEQVSLCRVLRSLEQTAPSAEERHMLRDLLEHVLKTRWDSKLLPALLKDKALRSELVTICRQSFIGIRKFDRNYKKRGGS